MRLWLSHHHDDELDRCVRVGGTFVCARCLGTYPTLFALVALQFELKASLSHPWDVALSTALVLPATLDWAWGRFRPHDFTNLWRWFTGLLLGAGLGRACYVHVQRPFPPVLLWPLGVVTAFAGPVILVSYLRRLRR